MVPAWSERSVKARGPYGRNGADRSERLEMYHPLTNRTKPGIHQPGLPGVLPTAAVSFAGGPGRVLAATPHGDKIRGRRPARGPRSWTGALDPVAGEPQE